MMLSPFNNPVSSHFSTPFSAHLHCTGAIRTCFGYLDKKCPTGSHNWENTTTSSHGYEFFRVCPLSSADDVGHPNDNSSTFVPIVLQIYFANKYLLTNNTNLANSLILGLNECFANANGFRDGQLLLLHPLAQNALRLCESLEIIPLGSDDWDAVVSSTDLVEELFLSQLRLVQPGLHFCLHLKFGDRLATFVARSRSMILSLLPSRKDNVLSPATSYHDSHPPPLLLNMGTRLLVAPPTAGDQKAIPRAKMAEREGRSRGDKEEEDEQEDEGGEPEGNIRNYIVPQNCYYHLLRVLPLRSGPDSIDHHPTFPSSHSQNPFFARDRRMCSLLNSLSFIFTLNDRRKSEGIRKWCVQVGDNHLGAILVELPMDSSGGDHFQDRISNLLEQFSHPTLRHCWISPALRRFLSPSIDLTWLRIRPIPSDQLCPIRRVTIHPEVDHPNYLNNARKAFMKLVAASRELYSPWMFPREASEWKVKLGEDESVYAKIVAEEETTQKDERNPSPEYRFIWPLSVQIEFSNNIRRIDGEGQTEEQSRDDEKEEDEPRRGERGAKWVPIPPHQDLIPLLQQSIRAFLQKQLHWGPGKPMALLLEGPIASGRSTVLEMLGEALMNGGAGFVPVATRMVNCAGCPFPRLLRSLESAMDQLSARWPSVLLLDNFDRFAEEILAESDSEQHLDSGWKGQKVYQKIFFVLFGGDQQRRKVPVICTVKEGAKPEGMFHWDDGQQRIVPERHRIRTMSEPKMGENGNGMPKSVENTEKDEQWEVIGKLIGGREVTSTAEELNCGTIGELKRIAEQFEMLSRGRNHELPHGDQQSILSDAIRAASSICKRNEFGEGQIAINFDQIAGLEDTKKRLVEVFIWPNKYPELFAAAGLNLGQRAILHGPSGCGKSMLIRSLAREMKGVNVISIRGPELLSKYIGQSEQNVRQLFARAKACRPALIIFDEFDALAPQRGSDNAHVTDRVVNQLLTELDGFEEDTEGVFLIAATNRIDLIDRALLRPGRIDHKLFVGMPDLEHRLAILRLNCCPQFGIQLSDNVNLKLIAQQTEGWSGAEVRAIVQNALWEAKEEEKGDIREWPKVCQRHLQKAVENGGGRGGGRKRMMKNGEEGKRKEEPQKVTLN